MEKKFLYSLVAFLAIASICLYIHKNNPEFFGNFLHLNSSEQWMEENPWDNQTKTVPVEPKTEIPKTEPKIEMPPKSPEDDSDKKPDHHFLKLRKR